MSSRPPRSGCSRPTVDSTDVSRLVVRKHPPFSTVSDAGRTFALASFSVVCIVLVIGLASLKEDKRGHFCEEGSVRHFVHGPRRRPTACFALARFTLDLGRTTSPENHPHRQRPPSVCSPPSAFPLVDDTPDNSDERPAQLARRTNASPRYTLAS